MPVECPNCASRYCPVTDTRTREVTFFGRKYTIARRRRVCQHCGLSFHTKETPEDDDLPDVPATDSPSPPKDPPGNPYL